MKKSFIAAIKARIVARNTSIKTFELFNNQLDPANMKKENPVKYPAVFIEFESIDWKQQGRGIQIGNARVKFHVADETYSTNISSSNIAESNDVDFLDLIAGLHVSLNGFDGETFTPLSRVSEIQDVNHDQIRVWQTVYSTQFTDDGAETRVAKPLINLVPDEIAALDLNLTATID